MNAGPKLPFEESRRDFSIPYYYKISSEQLNILKAAVESCHIHSSVPRGQISPIRSTSFDEDKMISAAEVLQRYAP